MNFDDLSLFTELDTQDMLSQIDGLPDQLKNAWELGQNLQLPDLPGISRVLVAGMGGSAIGADLLSAYASPICIASVVVHRDYQLPAWVDGKDTLVIFSSHSGNTEETLSAFKTARQRDCHCLAVTTGGKLAQLANQHGVPTWKFEHKGQPRAAVGFSFGLLLAVLTRLNLIPDPAAELDSAITAMKEQQKNIQANSITHQNPAKRLAGQLFDRWVTVLGSGFLTPVARRWKGQISEIAKAWAQFEFLPEANHNTLAGIHNPEALLSKTMVLFLRSTNNHPRNYLREELTRRIFMVEGLGTDFVDAQGDTRLANMWTCLHLGDYVAFYLAMAYGVDPTPVEAIESFKREMAAAGEPGPG